MFDVCLMTLLVSSTYRYIFLAYVSSAGVFGVVAKRGMIRVFQNIANPKFHLAVDNARVLGQVGGIYAGVKTHNVIVKV